MTEIMKEYYCDKTDCHFYHGGWCSYWDSTTELMKICGIGCKMNDEMYKKIDDIMENVIVRCVDPSKRGNPNQQ